jgi:hypothetical protein
VLAPIGIFGAQWHEALGYKSSGEAEVGGRSCLVIDVVPKGPRPEIDFLFGRAFIDRATLDILKIEWSEQRIGNYTAFEERGKRYGMKPRISVISEFEAEKNGIRPDPAFDRGGLFWGGWHEQSEQVRPFQNVDHLEGFQVLHGQCGA